VIDALPVAVVLAGVPSLAYLVVLNLVDRYEKEPWTILLACVGLGAVAAPLVASAVLLPLGRSSPLSPQFAADAGGSDLLVAVVQEVAKGGVLLALVHSVRDEFDDILDGVIYGAAIGAGFAAAETFVFALGGTGALDGETLAALAGAGLDHAFYTAAFGAAAGAATRLPSTREAVVVIGLGLASAVLLHALHDALPAILARLVEQPDAATGVAMRAVAQLVNVLGIGLLAVVVVLALRREARVLRTRLQEELELGVIGPEDYAVVPSVRARVLREVRTGRARGFAGLRAVRAVHGSATELAFHKERLEVRRRHRPSPERTEALRGEVLRNRRLLEEGS
jgi:protease PrsW